MDVNSYEVYSAIYPKRYNWLIWTFTWMFGLMCLLMSFLRDNSFLFYIGIAALLAFMVRYGIYWIGKKITYKNYRNFRNEVGFEILGWDSLIKNPLLLKPQHWAFNSSVEVKVKKSLEDTHQKVIHDALFLFIQRANTRFYKGRHSTGRKEWKFSSDYSVSGSADVAVSGDIYYLITEWLKPIQKTYGSIESVKVIWDDKIGYIHLRSTAQ